jgi:hypothetical protein
MQNKPTMTVEEVEWLLNKANRTVDLRITRNWQSPEWLEED